MADFNKVTITRKGQDLMTRIMALSKQMSFNSLQISTTAYKEEQLEGLTKLDNIKAVIIPRRIDKLDDVTVKIEGIIYNTGLTEGYYLRTLGLTANTPDNESLLYAVASADEPGYLPPYNGRTTMGALVRMIIRVGNSNNLEIKINPSAVATIGELEDLKQELTAKLDKEISNLDNTKADKTDTENRFHELYVAVSDKADSSTVSTNTQSITKLQGQAEALSKTISDNTAADDKKFESKTAHSNDINLLNKSIDGKADKKDIYTKPEIDSKLTSKLDEEFIRGSFSINPRNSINDWFRHKNFGFIFEIGEYKGNNPGKMDAGAFSPNIGFGNDDVRGTLSISYDSPNAVISGGSKNTNNTWSESIAWKSDIQKLKDEIDQLKKQISGGK